MTGKKLGMKIISFVMMFFLLFSSQESMFSGTQAKGAENYVMSGEVVLPRDETSFAAAVENYFNTRPEGNELSPRFEKIKISDDFTFCNDLDIDELIVEDGKILTIASGETRDGENQVTDKWASRIDVKKATINGNGSIVVNAHEPLPQQNGSETNRLVIHEELTIGENTEGEDGSVTVGSSVNGSVPGSFELAQNEPVSISVPSMDTIRSLGEFRVVLGQVVRMDNEYYMAEDDGTFVVFDGHQKKECLLRYTNDAWTAFWAPLDNEYNVRFDAGKVKIADGSEITANDYIQFASGSTIDFEIIPPAGYNGTPIVFVNGGPDNVGKNGSRSDDFRPSDILGGRNVTKLEVTNNRVSYRPGNNSGVEFSVYYDPEKIMEDAMEFVDQRYRDEGYYDGEGIWNYHTQYNEFAFDKDWADPGNEFMVEVTQNNSNGAVEMTPGIEFYRIGNKVKTLYQGFEVLSGGAVNVMFKPASGYDLLTVTIDSTSYAPLAVNGMTYSNGTYTLKIDSTPTIESAISGAYPENRLVKIKTIRATFGIPSWPTPPTPPTPYVAPTNPESVNADLNDEVATDPSNADDLASGEDKKETESSASAKDNEGGNNQITISQDNGDSSVKTQKKKDGTIETTSEIKNEDGTTSLIKEKKSPDGTVDKREETKDSKGNGSIKGEKKDAEGNILSKTEGGIKVSKKGTETIQSKTEFSDGSIEKRTQKSYIPDEEGNKKITVNVQKTDSEGNTLNTKTFTNIDITGKTTVSEKYKYTSADQGEKEDGKSQPKITEERQYSVTFNGKVKLTSLVSNNTTITIPESVDVAGKTKPVKTLAKNAFKGNQTIEHVVIENNITTIGNGTFKNCKKLELIELTGSIKKIYKNAFKGIAENAKFMIKADEETFEKIVELLKNSGVSDTVTFERVSE